MNNIIFIYYSQTDTELIKKYRITKKVISQEQLYRGVQNLYRKLFSHIFVDIRNLENMH